MRRLTAFAINFKYAFRFRKPLLVGRLVMIVLRSYILRRPSLRYVDCAVDFACNLKCQHCFATALRQDGRRKLGIDDYRDIARQCMALGAVNFSIQGGEPLLCDNLSSIVRAFEPWRNLISVTTNGTLLTGDRVVALKRMGVDILTISMDSAIPEEHDAFRGVGGSFEKTFNGVRLALKHGLRVTLGCVVTHKTLRTKGVLGLVEIAKQLKIILNLILPVAAGNWAHAHEIFLTEDDLRFIDDLTRSSPYVRTDFQANLGGNGCGAAKEILYLTPYGDVLTCPFLHVSAGNVFEEPIAAIRNRALRNSYFSGYHDRCLASTDAEFIKNYLSKTYNAKKLPLAWEDVFANKDTG